MYFRNEYAFLSNFYPSPVVAWGLTFSCVEAAFQAAKCPARRREFVGLNGAQARALGRRVPLRPDWNEARLGVMRTLLERKFADPEMRALLVATGEIELVEDNSWGDRYWGRCNGDGRNRLGRLLMEIRSLP